MVLPRAVNNRVACPEYTGKECPLFTGGVVSFKPSQKFVLAWVDGALWALYDSRDWPSKMFPGLIGPA